jgi:hypothetical protein
VPGDDAAAWQEILADRIRGREGIVKKAAGNEAAVLGIDEPFVQGGANRHRESAAHLAVKQGWVPPRSSARRMVAIDSASAGP